MPGPAGGFRRRPAVARIPVAAGARRRRDPRGLAAPGIIGAMPWDARIASMVDRYPALRAVGGTPLVPVDVFRDELPEVEVWAKLECLNPGGSLKDRPVLRMM